ncbi:MAG: TlpA family protein disulfide reductase [Pedobacter sp.]|nr:MAG: TlpA family protein disulfide reductase [Pedobacter sp.]
MKRRLVFFLLVFCCLHNAISQSNNTFKKDHSADWQTLTGDYTTWSTYTYYNIHLSRDFIGLGLDSLDMDKPTFLHKLLTEPVFAFKIGTLGEKDVYKLYPLTSTDQSIIAVNREFASTAIRNYKTEGKEMPAFNFTDVNGNIYDNVSTKGKTLVLKCWFIHCVACVKEFPDLNKLVNKYKDNQNVLFISLAIDSEEALTTFLKSKKFKYATVAKMKSFMENELNVTSYPTHLLIDSTGKIVKVVNRIEELVPFLEAEVRGG